MFLMEFCKQHYGGEIVEIRVGEIEGAAIYTEYCDYGGGGSNHAFGRSYNRLLL